MNFFESELKKIMGDSAILKDQKYVGRMCYGTIGGDLRARVEFVTLGVSDHYAGIKASVINRKEGVVDSILLQFSDIWGKQKVRGSIKDTAMNYIKGFMAVSLFTVVPVNLYSLCVSLQGTFGSAITGITNAESIGLTAQQVLMSASFPGIGNPILMTFCAVMMGYAVIKVFFANLKRGGILLIQIAVGSLYMFSVPRGYIDGFIQWCKQVIGICITAFLQSTILTAGLMVFKDHPLLGLGLMLSSTEVPRIAGQFGLDTSTKTNIMSSVYAAQTAINMTRTVVKAVAA